jgi:serum/glucocorticoid-regulated kinase 2
MKIIEKKNVTRESQVRHLRDERFILERVNSLFVVKLRYAF